MPSSVKRFMRRVASGNGRLSGSGSGNNLLAMRVSVRSEDDQQAKANSQFIPTKRVARPVRRTRSIQAKMQQFIQGEEVEVQQLQGKGNQRESSKRKKPRSRSNPEVPTGSASIWDEEVHSEKTLPLDLDDEQDLEPEVKSEPIIKEVRWCTSVDQQLEEKRVRLLTKPSKVPKRRMTRQPLVLVHPIVQELEAKLQQSRTALLEIATALPLQEEHQITRTSNPIDLDDLDDEHEDDEASVSSASSCSSSSSEEDSDDESQQPEHDEDDTSLPDEQLYFDN